jgi:hypothetical protein
MNCITSMQGQQFCTGNDQIYRIAESYAWSGLNFLLYAAGVAILIGVGIVAYESYKRYNPTQSNKRR